VTGVDKRSLRIQQRFEWPMIIAALLVIPALILQESSLGGDAGNVIGAVLNWIIWIAFLAELVTMLVVVPKPGLWLRQHPLDVAIVVLTPPVVPAGLQSLRVFRLLRVLRLVRLFTMRRVLSLEGVRDAAVIAAILVLAGGIAFSSAEGVSAWNGVWFALNMVTTVGAAGTANTVAGRMIAAVIMLVGIGFVAMVTAFIADRFIQTGRETEDREDRVLAKLEAIENRLARLEQRP
jgi:voltage-gated potassium channel